jgi:hypothetical protein
MADEVEEFKKKISVLEQRLALYETDAIYKGYYALNKIVNQQVDVLNAFNLKHELSSDPKADKIYDRTKAIWEGLKGMIVDLNALKVELRLSGDEDKDKKNVPFIERIAAKRD